jgi:aquaporin Z
MILEQARTQADQTNSGPRALSALGTLGLHWPEYLMEGVELGLYMISACAVLVLLQYPTSPVHQVFPNPVLRRVLFGIAMGMAAIGIIYSPLGQRSGAHFNPAVTLTFFRLGKVMTPTP